MKTSHSRALRRARLPPRASATTTLARRDDLESGTLGWVHWFNEASLHGSLGHVPAVEYEANYDRHINARQQQLRGEPSRRRPQAESVAEPVADHTRPAEGAPLVRRE